MFKPMPQLLRSTTAIMAIGLLGLAGAPAIGAPASPAAPALSPSEVRAPAGAPNVVIVLLDDVGFGASSTFGGPSATPTLDTLAREGLRYNRFHTTGICSPTRAALLTGRNAHAVGIGAVMNTADSRPGYRGIQQRDSATIAEVLRQNGYNTAAFGKWHQVADWEASPSGPFDRWPTGVGFEKFYGFIGGETDQYDPTLYEGVTPVMRPAGAHYHLTEDMADQAVKWMRTQHSVTPDKPFLLYFAPGATHAPLQVPKEWIARYRGKFDQGWDAIRAQILARQKTLGVVPEDAVLASRPDGIPAWDSLTSDQKRFASRLMETYAGFLEHTDAQVGKLVASLKDSGQFDNTIFIYIDGDNGASGEGGLYGSLNYMSALQGLPEDHAAAMQRLDDIGGPNSYAHYPAGWAFAMDTPFPWMKTVASHLGATRNPMVITWPKRITDHGGLRSQFGHVNDILPTILESVGLPAPTSVNGITQRPIDGTSLVYSFADETAPERHKAQYFEVFGNRAIYHDGWMASAFHGRAPWVVGIAMEDPPFENDKWELYNLKTDFSQAHDLAAREPAKLAALQALFMDEAARNQVLPLKGPTTGDPALPSLTGKRTEFTYHAGAVGIPEAETPKMLNRSWSLDATVTIPATGAQGVIATIGGITGGWSLYLGADGRPVFRYRLFDLKTVELTGPAPLAAGSHSLKVDFDYDGGGYAKGARIGFDVDGKAVGQERIPASPPGFFSISETFDIGIDSGSPAGVYPADVAPGYRFTGEIGEVTIRLR